MDEEARERKREEIRRRIAASKAAAAAKEDGAAGGDGEPAVVEGAVAVDAKSGEDAKDAGHRSVPSPGAQRKSAEDLKSESVQDFLCALIKAIKFANPSWGLKKVHKRRSISLLALFLSHIFVVPTTST